MKMQRPLAAFTAIAVVAGCSLAGTGPDENTVVLVLPDTIRAKSVPVGGSQSGGRLYCLFLLPASASFGPAGAYIKWTDGRMDRLEVRIQGRASTSLTQRDMAAAFHADSVFTGQAVQGDFRFDAGGPYYGDFALRYVRGPRAGAATVADTAEVHVQLECDVP